MQAGHDSNLSILVPFKFGVWTPFFRGGRKEVLCACSNPLQFDTVTPSCIIDSGRVLAVKLSDEALFFFLAPVVC